MSLGYENYQMIVKLQINDALQDLATCEKLMEVLKYIWYCRISL